MENGTPSLLDPVLEEVETEGGRHTSTGNATDAGKLGGTGKTGGNLETHYQKGKKETGARK